MPEAKEVHTDRDTGVMSTWPTERQWERMEVGNYWATVESLGRDKADELFAGTGVPERADREPGE